MLGYAALPQPTWQFCEPMRIEDEELRALFQAESEEHLQHLDEGLLRLEQDPHDQSILDEVYREAHSLKGAARMIGVHEVETVAHRFEDLLGPAKRGHATLTADLIDRLSKVLGGMRRLVEHAVTGAPSEVDVVSLLDTLSDDSLAVQSEGQETSRPRQTEGGKASTPSSKPTAGSDTFSQGKDFSGVPHSVEAPARPETPSFLISERASRSARTTHSETIRVDAKQLDALMVHAGELTVTRSRMSHRMSEVSQLTMLRENWMRELSLNRPLITKEAKSVRHGAESKLERFYQEQQSRVERLGVLVENLAKGVYDDQQRIESLAYYIDEGVRKVRLLPFSTLFERFRRTVRDTSRELGKEVDLIIEGGETTADKHVLDELKDPLMHLVRNAMDHGLETPEDRLQAGKARTGTLRLSASQSANRIVVTIIDDGRGLDVEAIKQTAVRQQICREEDLVAFSSSDLHSLIFSSGFSTRATVSDLSGRGIGMDVVRATVERLKGSIRLDSTPGQGCHIHIELPVTLSTMRVLTCYSNRYAYAFPIEFVETVRLVEPGQSFPLDGHEGISLEGDQVSVVHLSDLLIGTKERTRKQENVRGVSLPERMADRNESMACVIIKVGPLRLGCVVDGLGDEQEVVLKPYSTLLKRVKNVSGCTILGTGAICTILNTHDLLRSAYKQFAQATQPSSPAPVTTSTKKQKILLVDDSLTIRGKIKRLLERAGYTVDTAVDGVDGLDRLHHQHFDAVISDVEMPNMDGFTLTASIRANPSFTALPVILFTSLSKHDGQQKGQDVGASAYVVKTESAEVRLLETLKKLLEIEW